MSHQVYQFLHVFSIILLTGFTMWAASNPQKHKKKQMAIVTGILSLLALIAGCGLVSKLYNNEFVQGWIIVKIVAWLFISALSGMAYKKSKSFVLSGLIIAVAIAVYMVYFKPF